MCGYKVTIAAFVCGIRMVRMPQRAWFVPNRILFFPLLPFVLWEEIGGTKAFYLTKRVSTNQKQYYFSESHSQIPIRTRNNGRIRTTANGDLMHVQSTGF